LDVNAVNPYFSGRHVVKLVDSPDSGGFTGTRKSHHNEDLAFANGERNVTESDDVSGLLLDLVFVHTCLGEIECPPSWLGPKNLEYFFEANDWLGVRHLGPVAFLSVASPLRRPRRGRANITAGAQRNGHSMRNMDESGRYRDLSELFALGSTVANAAR
jgi:hypothetical protein